PVQQIGEDKLVHGAAKNSRRACALPQGISRCPQPVAGYLFPGPEYLGNWPLSDREQDGSHFENGPGGFPKLPQLHAKTVKISLTGARLPIMVGGKIHVRALYTLSG